MPGPNDPPGLGRFGFEAPRLPPPSPRMLWQSMQLSLRNTAAPSCGQRPQAQRTAAKKSTKLPRRLAIVSSSDELFVLLGHMHLQDDCAPQLGLPQPCDTGVVASSRPVFPAAELVLRVQLSNCLPLFDAGY